MTERESMYCVQAILSCESGRLWSEGGRKEGRREAGREGGTDGERVERWKTRSRIDEFCD